MDQGISSTHGFKALFNEQDSIYLIKFSLTNIRDYTGKIDLEPGIWQHLAQIWSDSDQKYPFIINSYGLVTIPSSVSAPYPACQSRAFWGEGTVSLFIYPGYLSQLRYQSVPLSHRYQ